MTVIAECEGFKGKAYLGCCSYKDEEDFKKGGYFEQMCKEAEDDLKLSITAAIAKGQQAMRLLGVER